MGTKTSILVDTQIDGTDYKAGNVVDFPAAQAKSLVNGGLADANADAIAYRLSQGEEVKVHGKTADPAPADAAVETQ